MIYPRHDILVSDKLFSAHFWQKMVLLDIGIWYLSFIPD